MMKIKMKKCASSKNFLYSHGGIYEVGKDLTQAMADSFLEINWAEIVEEEVPQEKPKKVKKKKNED
mgnify:FL=1